MNRPKPCMLIICDGWGIGSDNDQGSAVNLANTPNLDRVKNEYPNTHLLCSGDSVGLPKGIIGNSEVGHLNIGAGRVVFQDLLRIDHAIQDRSFFENKALGSVMSKVKKNGSALHLMGLVSDGGVHSHLEHLLALLYMAREKELANVFVHAITDGRDTSPTGGASYLEKIQDHIAAHHTGKIGTVCGRFYAMDRDNRWERIQKAYRLYVLGEGKKSIDPVDAVKESYTQNETDEFIQPIVMVNEHEKPHATIQNNDGLIFFNFRADRARQITRALTDPDFDSFPRDHLPRLCEFVCMTMYDEKFTLPMAYPPVYLQKILGEVISQEGLSQLRIAETEKYAHVTYFFNGGEETPFPNEDRCLIQSPRDIPTYDHKPEMSAHQLTEEVIKRMQSNHYDLIVLNFANMDMVGHTGIIDAAIKACETVDGCIGKILDQLKEQDGVALITADHGNSEKMTDGNGHPHTAHTLNPVPLILVDDHRKNIQLKPGRLADIAPTILQIMGIEQPNEMTGHSLLKV